MGRLVVNERKMVAGQEKVLRAEISVTEANRFGHHVVFQRRHYLRDVGTALDDAEIEWFVSELVKNRFVAERGKHWVRSRRCLVHLSQNAAGCFAECRID